MDAKDLMIDDWVKCVDSTHTISMFAQVDAIEEGHDCILVKRDISNWFLDIKYLEPIPLTAEILERNGFVYKEAEETCATEAFHQWRLDGSTFALDDNSWWRSVKDGKLRVKFGGFPLEYVHQLQHALRLCGIEKEIKL